jgi:hypothetical protein
LEVPLLSWVHALWVISARPTSQHLTAKITQKVAEVPPVWGRERLQIETTRRVAKLHNCEVEKYLDWPDEDDKFHIIWVYVWHWWRSSLHHPHCLRNVPHQYATKKRASYWVGTAAWCDALLQPA